MEIVIQIDDGFECKAGMRKLPIRISIESVVPVEVAEKIDINSAALIRLGDRNFFMGFSRSITSILRNSFVIDQSHPYRTEVNVLEGEESYDELIAGKYELRVEATLYLKSAGGYSAKVLSSSIPLVIGT